MHLTFFTSLNPTSDVFLQFSSKTLTFPGQGGYRPSFPLEKTQRVSICPGKDCPPPSKYLICNSPHPLISICTLKCHNKSWQTRVRNLASMDGPNKPKALIHGMQNCTRMCRRYVHSSGTKGYNKTTKNHLSSASSWWGWGPVCSVNTDFPLQSVLIHREDLPALPNTNGSLPLGQETSYAARGRRRQSILVRAVVGDTEADYARYPRRHWSLPSLKEKRPLHSFTGQRHQSDFDTRCRGARTGQFPRNARLLTGLPRREGSAGSTALLLYREPQQDPEEQASAADAGDALHNSCRRRAWSIALYQAASRIRAGPITATLGLSPSKQGCPFRPVSFPASAPHLALFAAWSAQKGSSGAGRELCA